MGEYNKLAARKIGPLEILEKINPNAYRLKLPSHMHTSNVFNVKHLFHIEERIPIQTPNSRTRFFQAREDDASHIMKNKEFFIFIFFPI